jgi:hypothetical protein
MIKVKLLLLLILIVNLGCSTYNKRETASQYTSSRMLCGWVENKDPNFQIYTTDGLWTFNTNRNDGFENLIIPNVNGLQYVKSGLRSGYFCSCAEVEEGRYADSNYITKTISSEVKDLSFCHDVLNLPIPKNMSF